MIKNVLNNFIRGLKPFCIISFVVALFIGVIFLAMISKIFWWFCIILCMIILICGLGSTRNKK